MKRLLFVFSLILFAISVTSAQQKETIVSATSAQQKATTASATSTSQKEAVFVIVGDSIHDFGTIKEADGPVSHTFTIKNAGGAPLVIQDVKPGCGCTTPTWTKEPIAAGKTGTIKITYDPTNRPQPFTRSIPVITNGYTGSYILIIKGVVEPKK